MNIYKVCFAQFEYDHRKNEANLEKHGISFEEAKAIWDDPNYLKAPAKKRGEKRYLAIGIVNGMHIAAIATDRGDAIRIISARRASKRKVMQYERDDRH